MAEELPSSIPEYFAGKNIFVTGATGFIGKVLIEKLLRSCPDVRKIYVLIRPKKGKSPDERIKAMTNLPLFDILKEKYPKNLQKILPIIGDVVELDLGMCPEDRKILIEEVHIVYHIAASVRFDDSLRDAVIMNTRGTREVAKLSKEMKHLEVFFHFSTTYCQSDKKVVEEELYPPHADWRKTIEVIENGDPHVLEVLTSKYTEPFPNTYTFSKSLAEHVVDDLCDGQIPAIVFRPSIVVSTMLEPFSGWIDNFNGPVGIMVATGKGIMRSVYAHSDVIADYMPCDTIVQATLIATWKKGIEKGDGKNKLAVYNGSNNKMKYVTMGEMVLMGKKLCWETPLNDILWYPNVSVTNCWYYNYFKVIFSQLLPALFIDGLLVSLKKKPLLVKIQRKIFTANNALHYFLSNEWVFINTKAMALEKLLLPSDQLAFSYKTDSEQAVPFKFFTDGLMGCRRYLLNEPNSTMPQAKIHSRRMWLIAQMFNSLWYLVGFILLYQLFLRIDIHSMFSNAHTYFNA